MQQGDQEGYYFTYVFAFPPVDKGSTLVLIPALLDAGRQKSSRIQRRDFKKSTPICRLGREALHSTLDAEQNKINRGL